MNEERYKKALQDICATVDRNGHPVGHWHGTAVKIARAAIFNYEPILSDKDKEVIAYNLPRSNEAAK